MQAMNITPRDLDRRRTIIVVGERVWEIFPFTDAESLDTASSSSVNNQSQQQRDMTSNNSAVTDTVTWQPWELEAYVNVFTKVLPVVFALISVLAVSGNVAVISVIARHKKMRTPVNLFLMNLAVSDVIFASVALPIVTYRYATSAWQGGEFLCRIHTYVIHSAIYVSVYTMVAIAVFRCVTVTRGRIAQRLAVRLVLTFIGSVWIVMLLANSPLLHLYRIRALDNYVYCGVVYGKELFMVFFICAYALPISISVVCYSVIIAHISRKRKQLQSAILVSSYARAVRVTRLLIIVLMTFTLCWLPVHIQLLLAYHGRQPVDFVHEIFRLLSCVCGNSSTVLNPIIYNFACPQFRAGFRHLWYTSRRRSFRVLKKIYVDRRL